MSQRKPGVGTQLGGRKLVERLGAHIAFLLNNATGDLVEVKPFALFTHLIALLAGRGPGGEVYRDGVVAYQLAGADRSADEAAQAYIDRVLDRGIFLARDNHLHIAHELFQHLCQRGVADGWAETVVTRDGSAGGPTPSDFKAVADRLDRLDKAISPGNPAQSTRAKAGVLELRTDRQSVEIAEELSAWKAIVASPNRQRVLREGPDFDRLCSLMIKAVEAANAHYGALVRLGLPPLDWMEAVSINTAKGLSAFISELKAPTGQVPEDIGAWRTVWVNRDVPGFKSVEDLWSSEVGRFLRRPVVVRIVHTQSIELHGDDDHDTIGTETDADLLDEDSAAALVHEALKEGAVSRLDAWIFGQVCAGKTLAEIGRSAQWTKGPGADSRPLADYVSDLRGRLLHWARSRIDGDTG